MKVALTSTLKVLESFFEPLFAFCSIDDLFNIFVIVVVRRPWVEAVKELAFFLGDVAVAAWPADFVVVARR